MCTKVSYKNRNQLINYIYWECIPLKDNNMQIMCEKYVFPIDRAL